LGAGYASSATAGNALLHYRRKRITPSYTLSAASTFSYFYRAAGTPCTGFAAHDEIHTDGGRVLLTIGAVLTTGDGVELGGNNASTSSLIVDARL